MFTLFKTVGLVFLGGGLGSILRYIITKLFVSDNHFYIGTGVVNIIGSFVLGYVSVFLSKHVQANWVPEMGLFVAIGFCGGFTTFSTFAYENIQLLVTKRFIILLLYTFGSLILSLLALRVGMYIAGK